MKFNIVEHIYIFSLTSSRWKVQRVLLRMLLRSKQYEVLGNEGLRLLSQCSRERTKRFSISVPVVVDRVLRLDLYPLLYTALSRGDNKITHNTLDFTGPTSRVVYIKVINAFGGLAHLNDVTMALFARHNGEHILVRCNGRRWSTLTWRFKSVKGAGRNNANIDTDLSILLLSPSSANGNLKWLKSALCALIATIGFCKKAEFTL